MNIIIKILKKMNQIKRQYQHRDQCIFGSNVIIDKNVIFEGGNCIQENARVLNCELGFGSYVGENSSICNAKVGRYCCIGGNVRTIAGNHPVDKFVSVHPAFYSTRKQSGFSYVKEEKFSDFNYIQEEDKKAVLIGNDVWIGDNVSILEHIVIGTGAVLAAGAVVTKDVPDYAIVGGVPAKVIRYRFDEETIELLQKTKWWNQSQDWLEKNAEIFESIEKFQEYYKASKDV